MVWEQDLDVLQYLLETFLKMFLLFLCIDISSIDKFPNNLNNYLFFHVYVVSRVVVSEWFTVSNVFWKSRNKAMKLLFLLFASRTTSLTIASASTVLLFILISNRWSFKMLNFSWKLYMSWWRSFPSNLETLLINAIGLNFPGSFELTVLCSGLIQKKINFEG